MNKNNGVENQLFKVNFEKGKIQIQIQGWTMDIQVVFLKGQGNEIKMGL